MSEKTITKSIRLSPAESADVARLSTQRLLSESALMKKWVQNGIQEEKIEIAIQAYMQRKVDIRSGAAMAEVSYNRFMRELQEHNVVILEDDHFLENLGRLAIAFNDEALRRAVIEVSQRVSGETNNEMIHSLRESTTY